MLSRPGQKSAEGVMVTPDVGVLMLTPVAADDDAKDNILALSRLIRGRELGREVAMDAIELSKLDGAGLEVLGLTSGLLGGAGGVTDMLRFSGVGSRGCWARWWSRSTFTYRDKGNLHY